MQEFAYANSFTLALAQRLLTFLSRPAQVEALRPQASKPQRPQPELPVLRINGDTHRQREETAAP